MAHSHGCHAGALMVSGLTWKSASYPGTHITPGDLPSSLPLAVLLGNAFPQTGHYSLTPLLSPPAIPDHELPFDWIHLTSLIFLKYRLIDSHAFSFQSLNVNTSH